MRRSVGEIIKSGFSPARIWVCGFLVFLAINIAWELINSLPAAWDMAYHQLMGLKILDAFSRGNFWEGFARTSQYYPPFYYLIEAMMITLFGDHQFLPLLANLPGIFLLSYFTFRIAERIVSPSAAACSGILVLMLPMVSWSSRVSLLDTGLAGWVILALYLVIRSDYFQHRGLSILFGIVCAAGMLHKWSFVFFLAIPVLSALVFSNSKKRSLVNMFLAAAITVPLAGSWYWPNLEVLAERFSMTAEAGTQFEQDPGLGSIWGWIYYLRCLSGYYLFIPLSLLLLISLVRMRNRIPFSRDLKLLLVFLGGSLAILTVLEMKDPRYIMPAAPALLILLLAGWENSKIWSKVLIPVICLVQMLLASFSLPFVPLKIAFFEMPDDHSFREMNYEWVLFANDYFGILGRARNENWPLEKMLENVKDESMVAVVPEHPYLNPTTLGLVAYRKGLKNLQLTRIGQDQPPLDETKKPKWILGKTGPQGVGFLTRFNQEVYAALPRRGYRVQASAPLPDGSKAILWKRDAPG